MNERIKELVKQAMVREAYYPAGNNGHPEYRSYVSQEKFAELLIRECANQCTTEGPFVAEVVWGKQFHKKIKEHFGVEE